MYNCSQRRPHVPFIEKGMEVILPNGERGIVQATSSIYAYVDGSWWPVRNLSFLPKVTKRVKVNDHNFRVTVASTAWQKARGLEVVSSLAEDEGMWFPFGGDHVTFHMGSVGFPIDILFIKDNILGLKVAKIIHNAQPGAREHWSCDRVRGVLEIPGGSCKALGIKLNSSVEVS